MIVTLSITYLVVDYVTKTQRQRAATEKNEAMVSECLDGLLKTQQVVGDVRTSKTGGFQCTFDENMLQELDSQSYDSIDTQEENQEDQ